MVNKLELTSPVNERPLSDWSTIAVELLGTQSRIVKGERWSHHVIEAGEGPPLFMYHGIGGHVETYARTLPQLAKDYHVIAAEAIYHGYSSKPPFDPVNWIDVMTDGVIDLADAFGYDTFNYEGESMGGMMGVNLGFRYPERVQKLILNGFAQVRTDREFKNNGSRGDLMELSRAAVSDPSDANIRARLEWLVGETSRIDDEMVAIRKRLYEDPAINASLQQVFGLDGSQRVAQVYDEADFEDFTVGDRTLILWGEFNPGRGYDYAQYVAELIGAKFYGVDDTGHWPQWERPDEYVQVLRQFLNS